MAKIYKKDSSVAYELPDEIASGLGLSQNSDYELVELSPGSYALIEKKFPGEISRHTETDKKIFKMIEEKSYAERVEGKFEKLLSSEELKRFKELLKEGKIVLYKSSDKYKKAIYKLSSGLASGIASVGKEVGKKIMETSQSIEEAAARAKMEQKKEEASESPTQIENRAIKEKITYSASDADYKKKQYSGAPSKIAENLVVPSTEETRLIKQEYAIVRDENVAKALSARLSDDIKRKEVLGIKTFDGEYFIIKRPLYDKCSPIILQYIIAHNTCTIEAISNDLGLDKDLVKIVCEFLRESGEITERRKGIYEYIS
ncbi:MAG: hypothetical protein N3F05_01635 [Candidatus Diapherotrites archaeon]|nr:hypothetical protein [Candidatus Diapherotrites archaeon]